MTKLDEALENYVADERQQEQYYRLLLDSDFYIPVDAGESETPLEQRENLTPLVIEAEGKHYLPLFDTVERLNDWAKEPTDYMILAGYEMVNYTPAGLHWAINLGSERAKELVPEELNWLKGLPLQAG